MASYYAPMPTSTFAVRPVRTSDRDRVLAGMAALSPASLYLRFGRATLPSAPDLAWLDVLDGRTAVAYGVCDLATGAPVGVARYVADRADEAEVAVTVVDGWQGRGAGTLLLRRLADHAAGAGITALSAWIFSSNRPAIALMLGIGASYAGPAEAGVVRLRAQLAIRQVIVSRL